MLFPFVHAQWRRNCLFAKHPFLDEASQRELYFAGAVAVGFAVGFAVGLGHRAMVAVVVVVVESASR